MAREKLCIAYPIIVEGKYDKIRLSNIVEGTILTTDGFGVFKSDEKKALLRRMADRSPLILMTDSDGGGKIIRSHLCGMIPKDRLIQLYIPQIKGREKRKTADSAAGFLGVEGMQDDLLYDLLLPYATPDEVTARRAENPLSKTDFFVDGLTGGENSTRRRDELAVRVGLPVGMSANALLEALRWIIDYEEYLRLVGRDV